MYKRVMKCTLCNEEKSVNKFVSIYDPLVCKECSPVPERVGKSWRNPWGTASAASRSTRSKQEDAKQIKKVFKWALWGWTAFFILGWFINHDLRYLAEIVVSVGLGVAAAFISTLIYWGIRELLKPNADTVRRADAAESELAELRKKIEELSKQSET